jgi:DGQHR domain-containing protein
MKLPLIKITQKNEFIYLTKLSVDTLRKYVALNFRYPYLDIVKNNEKEIKQFDLYLKKLVNKGLKVSYSNESVQRRLHLDRLKAITNYVNEENNIIPNSIILGCFNKKIESNDGAFSYDDLIKPINIELGIYELELNDDYEMIAIDGQHRLAGLFISENSEVLNMELSVILLFGPSLSVSSKIFIDINGNQKAVDKSLIYDLTAILENDLSSNKVKDKEIESIQACHKICKAFYTHEKSPLYRQIRMLGTGKGAISQSFLVEALYPIIHTGVLRDYKYQEQFNAIYFYLKAVQTVFQEDWPVLDNENNILSQDDHAFEVLYRKKSQLSKTLGLGALLLNFPFIFKECKFDANLYLRMIFKLKGKIVWSKEEYQSIVQKNDEKKPIYIEGTNKAAIQKLARDISTILFDKDLFSK